jgi:hypothetical protein
VGGISAAAASKWSGNPKSYVKAIAFTARASDAWLPQKRFDSPGEYVTFSFERNAKKATKLVLGASPSTRLEHLA